MSSTDVPITITTTGNVTYTAEVNFSTDFQITDVNVLINITHTWNADLDMFLIAPDGTRVELATDVGGSSDNFTNTIFDQESATIITAGTAPYTGSFRPEGDLSVLYGTQSAGTWILEVTDDAGGDGGTINNFELEICGLPALSVNEYTEASFSIYPNPNNGTFNIKINSPSGEPMNVSVFDMRGRQVYRNRFESGLQHENTIDLGSVQAGVYLVNLSDGLQSITKKIVVE